MAKIGIDKSAFERIAREYRQRWSLGLAAVSPDGEVVYAWGKAHVCPDKSPQAVSEALRWGEPTMILCPHKQLIWAAPLMTNAKLTGGLLASATERRVFPTQTAEVAFDVRRAAADLLMLTENANLTNAALLAAHREEALRQRKRAEAIHEVKVQPIPEIRQMYLQEEPALLFAIRNDDRNRAREIINHLLAAIYYRAGSRLTVIKSFLLELVVTMSRTAVEAGGKPEELLGANFTQLANLAEINTERELAQWLHGMLERVMDALVVHNRQPHAALASAAIRHINDHFAERISRDSVAESLGVSPSHFTRLLKKQLGQSFSDLLTQIRLQHAADMLSQTDQPLAGVALRCGFRDQSYFTKVFARYFSMTPRQYRLKNQQG